MSEMSVLLQADVRCCFLLYCDFMVLRHVCSCSVGSVGTFNLVFQEVLTLKAPGHLCSQQTKSRSTHDRCESGRVMQSHHMVSR